MPEQLERSTDIIELRGEQTAGWEHRVWLDKVEHIVRKIPNWIGKLWQVMLAEFARRDISVMMSSGINIMPTNVREVDQVSIAGRVRDSVGYVLEQPLFEHSHPMSYGDMLHGQRYRDEVLDLARIGQDIQQQGLGLDLLGGKAFNMVPSAISPMIDRFATGVSNLLVADEDIVARQDWPDYGLVTGDLIASKGAVRHCDTRLYDWNQNDRMGDRIIRYILQKAQEVQDTVLWTILADFDDRLKSEYELETNRLRRMVKKLVEHAIPKMRLYAEKNAT